MYVQRFTFLCTNEEKADLARLASIQRRSKSDVIRLLLRNAIHDLSVSINNNENNKGVENEQPFA